MKKMRIVWLIAASAVLFVLISCRNDHLSGPQIPPGGVSERGLFAPDGVKASHGEKRSITLSWNSDSNAARYYIYNSDSPLNPFVRCGETSSNQFKFTVSPGRTIYYRVSSAARDGTESAQSVYVMGSSLAQPLITDITDITESKATVTWYMDNVSDKTYKAGLRYTVYCFVKGGENEAIQQVLDGSQLSENKAEFTGLLAGKEYSYQVEAYLVHDQSNSEKSEIMDRETARRFRPVAPINLSASRGIAVDKVELSFELPEMVNIALSANEFELHGLYFVIWRKFGNTEYLKVCSYFGAATEDKPNFAKNNVSSSTFQGSYDLGKTVTWTDTKVIRGVVYEYMVQSYVDGTARTISSDTSKAQSTGWALSQGAVSLGRPKYTLDINGNLYASAELQLNFTFDSKGEEYRYKVMETIKPIGDEAALDPDGIIERESDYLTLEQMINFRARMNLQQKSTRSSPGRGVYSYQVNICLTDDDNTPIDTLTAVGDVTITEDTNPIVVEGFAIQDGYTDKFRIRWENYESRKYILLASLDGINWTSDEDDEDIALAIYNPIPLPDVENEQPSVRTEVVVAGKIAAKLENYTPDKKVYFAMQPIKVVTAADGFTPVNKKGQREYSGECWTLGVPKELKVDGRSYSALTAAWDEAKKADTYRIKYKYTADADWKIAKTVSLDELSLDAYNQLTYQFKPEGTAINIAKAGEEIEVQVEALNKSLQAAVKSETGKDEGEIFTSSEVAESQLVGPAKLDPKADKAASADTIEVSWNKIAGADGYYVFRRQFNMNNTAERGVQSSKRPAVAYYISADEKPTVTGISLSLDTEKPDTATVMAKASYAASRYTLKDEYMTDAQYSGAYSNHIAAYKDQQNEMAWGSPYRYYVVPVINRDDAPESPDSIEFSYAKDPIDGVNTNITSFIIKGNGVTINYSGAAALEQTGFTFGFGQNVTATKGTYTSSGNVNNGIKITWVTPPLLATVPGFSPRYTLYRRESGGSTWSVLRTNESGFFYIDVQLADKRGIAYEYAVGVTNGSLPGGSDPRTNARFIDECYDKDHLDDKGRPFMLGFMLDMVKMEGVSRNEQKLGNEFAEEVKWKSAGIKYRNGVGNKWGIEGYEVWVMNRNVDAAWHKIAEISYDIIPDQIDQSIMVTNVKSGNTLEGGLLKVMRDYRHFFKVRSYVLNDANERVYCPDPDYAYKYYWKDDERYKFETDYVKWGARQITATEFAKIAMVYMCDGIDQVNGTAWNTGYFGKSANADGDGTTGKIEADSNFGVNSWTFTFTNYKTDLQVKTGEWQHFLTINGKLWAGTNAVNQYPQAWGYLKDIEIKGPSDTPYLYTGKMAIGGGTQRGGSVSYRDLPWGDGDISVKYPASSTVDQKITMRGEDTPMLFSGHGDRRYQADAWK